MIRVRYRNGQTGRVPHNQLEKMIRAREILGFERAKGWVEVESGRLRRRPADIICVPERRADLAYRQMIEELELPGASG